MDISELFPVSVEWSVTEVGEISVVNGKDVSEVGSVAEDSVDW